MTEKVKRNRQKRRSKRMLQEALLELLAEKAYAKITISDVSERADLARSTFYAHFETKDELLTSYIDDMFADFFAEIRAMLIGEHGQEDASGLDIGLFEQWKAKADILKLIRTPDVDNLILERFRHHHFEVYKDSVALQSSARNPALAGYYISFLANATIALLMQWTVNDMRHAPEIMGKLLYQLTGPAVADAFFAEFSSTIS